MMPAVKPKNVDEYIAGFPATTQAYLKQIRDLIRKSAPAAEETISYAIPTFNLNGTYLIYFAGYKNHVSVYPAPKGNAPFEKKISPFRAGKGTVQFSLDRPLPLGLLAEMVQYNLRANQERTKSKKKGP